MTFSLSDDEQNGVSIAVNTILKIAYGVGETEDWSQTADEWWNQPRFDGPEEGRSAVQMLADNPGAVVELALYTLKTETLNRQVGIYVLPSEEGLPPRAAFVVEFAPGVQGALGGVAYIDGAWRFPNGQEVEEELAKAITEHAENLGVEWDH